MVGLDGFMLWDYSYRTRLRYCCANIFVPYWYNCGRFRIVVYLRPCWFLLAT